MLSNKVRQILLVALVMGFGSAAAADRFYLLGEIKGVPLRLVLDTGQRGQTVMLFRPAAERLPLKLRVAQTNEFALRTWITEECSVSLKGISFWGLSMRAPDGLQVFELPSGAMASSDGWVGWGVFSHRTIRFDGENGSVNFLRKVPREAESWTKLTVRTNLGVLALEIADNSAPSGIVIVDTGADSGLGLSPRKWHEWRSSNPDKPTRIETGFMFKPGLIVRKRGWADQISIGSLRLTDLAISETDPVNLSHAPTDHVATLGMAALKRVDLIVDGKAGVAYLRPKTSPSGLTFDEDAGPDVLFAPGAPDQETLVAHVADGSLAQKAGIQDGDVLLKIGTHHMSHWRTDKNLERWLEKTADVVKLAAYSADGTNVLLTLRRDERHLIISTPVKRTAVYAPRTAAR